MKNQFFSFSRFVSLWRYDIFDNSKSWTIILIVLATSFFGCEFFEDRADWLSIISFNIFFFTCLFFPLVSTTRIFKNVRDKQGRIGFLMIPASKFEKFMVRLINMVVIPIVFVCVVSLLILYWVDFSEVDSFFEAMRDASTDCRMSVVCTVAFAFIAVCVFHVSLTLFFGTLYKKQVFVKSIVSLIAFNVAVVKIIYHFVEKEVVRLEFNPNDIEAFSAECSSEVVPVSIGIIAASIVLVWGAYKIFCRKTV